MTESIDDLIANGSTFAPTPVPISGGFDAGEGWDSHYSFKAAGVDAEGDIPMPSQTKIDNFQRSMAKLFIDLDVAERQEREARAATEDERDTRPAEERMAEVEEALKLKREVYSKFRDAAANVCSGSPSRKELGQLNEPTFLRFLNWLGGLLNPNV
jgi:hypothetical protein